MGALLRLAHRQLDAGGIAAIQGKEVGPILEGGELHVAPLVTGLDDDWLAGFHLAGGVELAVGGITLPLLIGNLEFVGAVAGLQAGGDGEQIRLTLDQLLGGWGLPVVHLPAQEEKTSLRRIGLGGPDWMKATKQGSGQERVFEHCRFLVLCLSGAGRCRPAIGYRLNRCTSVSCCCESCCN